MGKTYIIKEVTEESGWGGCFSFLGCVFLLLLIAAAVASK